MPFSGSGCAGFESGDGDSDGHGAGSWNGGGVGGGREQDTAGGGYESIARDIARIGGGILQAPDADIEVGNPDF